MSELDRLIDQAQGWLEQDPDPETRDELERLILDKNLGELRARFGNRIGFGTAGLRGQLGAGPNRMNRVLVSQAASGIADYLAEQNLKRVVIGFDARKNSKVFARDSAEILAARGLEVYVYKDLVATPMVAFAVRELNCDLGIMVTASHNPPQDNGYKVYESSGSQIVSPTDQEISNKIELVANVQNVLKLPRSTEFQIVPANVIENYLESVSNFFSSGSTSNRISVVYSAMHGVGAKFIEAAFRKIGLEKPIQVESQKQPDGNFPTVKFPNPEEPGAMDLALEQAESSKADLVLVNDPDADRLAVAFRAKGGELIKLTGDELGLLLGEDLARKAKTLGKTGNLTTSIVSSSALAEVAKEYGFGFKTTLTGFKWISRIPDLIFGYEEALGYCVDSEHVRDKDGISAAIAVVDLAQRLAESGLTLGDHLAALQKRYGYFETAQISIRVEELEKITTLMTRLRSNPPRDLCGVPANFTDLGTGSSELPPTDGIRFETENQIRVIIRPSGTEPKLKCYLQVKADSKIEATGLLKDLKAQMQELLA